VMTLHARPARAHLSLTGGRGFVPFGTDDPMVRGFVKYPANHHLAQALERWVLVGAAGAGPVTLEAALLNGDEPTGPADLGRIERFGDSWAARVTLRPGAGLELQGSTAHLASPEISVGGGHDQRKHSTSARWTGALRGPLHGYALAEWARTDEHDRVGRAFRFHTALAEAAVGRGGASLALRLERTERPEEERGFDPFRAPPQHSGPLLGLTEWTIASARLAHQLGAGRIGIAPFIEGAVLRVTETAGSIFSPAEFYGSERQWHLSIGAALATGQRHTRMGRYGAAADPTHH
jgi:hypothetical protein